MIRKAGRGDAALLARLIRDSFHDVAVRFALTPANCPKHPSNCTSDWIEKDLSRGVRYFVFVHENVPVGCVGLEHPAAGLFYLERLAVLPEKRRKGFGRALVQKVVDCARADGGGRISIGLIAGQCELRCWYAGFGFADVTVKQFSHLPFDVLLMELVVDSSPSRESI